MGIEEILHPVFHSKKFVVVGHLEHSGSPAYPSKETITGVIICPEMQRIEEHNNFLRMVFSFSQNISFMTFRKTKKSTWPLKKHFLPKMNVSKLLRTVRDKGRNVACYLSIISARDVYVKFASYN